METSELDQELARALARKRTLDAVHAYVERVRQEGNFWGHLMPIQSGGTSWLIASKLKGAPVTGIRNYLHGGVQTAGDRLRYYKSTIAPVAVDFGSGKTLTVTDTGTVMRYLNCWPDKHVFGTHIQLVERLETAAQGNSCFVLYGELEKHERGTTGLPTDVDEFDLPLQVSLSVSRFSDDHRSAYADLGGGLADMLLAGAKQATLSFGWIPGSGYETVDGALIAWERVLNTEAYQVVKSTVLDALEGQRIRTGSRLLWDRSLAERFIPLEITIGSSSPGRGNNWQREVPCTTAVTLNRPNGQRKARCPVLPAATLLTVVQELSAAMFEDMAHGRA
ncbi:hypothetical protein ACIQMR_31780 [Streptomyces sp. NPDC091376]|uniref:hypothetical protein n=1 Tax=Streptomyces sp. NPDC091376 TaxID=3365994 RepID=UPI0038078F52